MADPKKNPFQRRENRLPLEPPSLSTRRKDRRPPRPL